MALHDPSLKELQEQLKAWHPGTIFFVLAIDPDTGERTWFTTAAGPWNDELRNAAAEYERFVPDDCAQPPFPLDPGLPTTN